MWPFRKADSRVGGDAAAKLDRMRAVTDPKKRFDEIVRLLLVDNPRTRPALDGPPPGRRLTEGQETLASVAVLDHQVENGGLLQLFWNCPGRIEHILASLRALGLDALATDFDRAANDLGTRFDVFERLRADGDADSFAEAAEAFDFEWFDDAYLGRYERGKLIQPGANLALYDAGLRLVNTKGDQFVRP